DAKHLLDDLAVVVAAVAAQHQRLALEPVQRVEDRLDEVLCIVFLAEHRHLLAKARRAGFLVVIGLGGNGTDHASAAFPDKSFSYSSTYFCALRSHDTSAFMPWRWIAAHITGS